MEKFDWAKHWKRDIHGKLSHGYETVFNKHLDRSKKVVVEFGARIFSADLWRDYFTDAKLYFYDIVEFTPPDNSTFEYFDMHQESSYDKLPNNIDVIIEDGPHTSKSQILVLKHCLPRLNKGGVIVFEDLHCTEPQYKGDYKKFKGDSDITLNELLREWKEGIFNDYKYINGSEFKNMNITIDISNGDKKRAGLSSPSEIITVVKNG